MLAAPTTSSHQLVTAASSKPTTAANAKAANAATFTDRDDARPEATSRTGPTRESSVPRIPSE